MSRAVWHEGRGGAGMHASDAGRSGVGGPYVVWWRARGRRSGPGRPGAGRACPVRVDCLVDAMPVARMRDDTTIVGGLTTPARARLQRLVADGLHAPASLAGIPPRMVRMWLLAHPDAPDQACRQTQAQWSGAKRRWRAARARPAPTVGVPASSVMV